MSKIIYKYPLEIKTWQSLNLPKGYEILTIQIQRGIPQLWAMVDPSKEVEIVTIEFIGTGQPITDECDRKYINTIQSYDGLVWHVFENKSVM